VSTRCEPLPGRRAWLRSVFGVDTRSLACLRIGLGILLLVNLAERAPVFGALYGNAGVFPATLAHGVNPGWDGLFFPYLASGRPGWIASLGGLSALLAAGLALGWRTRLCTLGSWYLLASLDARDPLAASYEHQVLRLLLFFGAFVPLGARWSLDARAGRGRSEGVVVGGGSAALLLQFAAIYFFSALEKTGPAWHADADAIGYAVSQNYWARPVAASLLAHAEWLAPLTRITWHWELLLPLALLSPFRPVVTRTLAVASVWAFHGSLWLCLAIGIFPATMMVGATAFLPGAFWDRLAARSGRAAPDPGNGAGLPRRAAALRDGVPLACIALVCLVNVSGLPGMGFLPPRIVWLAGTLRLDQGWRMYAPEPEDFDYFYVMPGRLADGRVVDVVRDGTPVSDEPPSSAPWRNPPRPWALHLDQARIHRRKGLARPVAAYLCRRWNDAHTGVDRLVLLEWHMERYELDGRGGRSAPERRVIGRWRCAQGPLGITRPLDARRPARTIWID
jgi:hypothetical protein